MYEDTDPARGVHIATLRNRKLMTQAALATAAGLHVGTVKRAETGKPLSAETAQALCSVLELAQDGLTPSTLHTPEQSGREAPSTVGAVHGAPAATSLRFTWHEAGLRILGIGVAIQAFAWCCPETDEDHWWWFCEFISIDLVMVGLVVIIGQWCLDRLLSPPKAMAGYVLAFAVCAALMVPYQFYVASPEATGNALWDALRVHIRLDRVIKNRKLLDPRWDPNLSEWHKEVWWNWAQNRISDDLITPGTLAHRTVEKNSCLDDFVHAASYDVAKCGDHLHPVETRSWRKLGYALMGLSTVPGVNADYPWEPIIGGEGFARAREIFDAHHTGFGVTPDEAAAMDAQARQVAHGGGSG